MLDRLHQQSSPDIGDDDMKFMVDVDGDEDVVDDEVLLVDDVMADDDGGGDVYDPFADRYGTLDEDTLCHIEHALDSGDHGILFDDIDVDIWKRRIGAYRTLKRHRESNEKTKQRFKYQLSNLGDDELLFYF